MSDDLIQRLRRLGTIHEREQEVIRHLREQEARALVDASRKAQPANNIIPFKPHPAASSPRGGRDAVGD